MQKVVVTRPCWSAWSDSVCTVQLRAPGGVLFNLVQQPQYHRTLVHLLNYTGKPAEPASVVLGGKYASAWVISPDKPEKLALTVPSSSPAELKLPALGIYSLLVLESR